LCDIYTARCEKCGKEIEMHLGDFETRRDEIVVLCSEHVKDYKKYGDRCVFWLFNPIEVITYNEEFDKNFLTTVSNPIVAVISLTDNAWENRFYNHPNYGFIFPVTGDLTLFEDFINVWSRYFVNRDGELKRLLTPSEALIEISRVLCDFVETGNPSVSELAEKVNEIETKLEKIKKIVKQSSIK